MTEHILFHFGELALKGKNRHRFERRMAENIRQVLGDFLCALHKEHGRMLASITHVKEDLIERLKLTPGIRNFALVRICKADLDEIRRTACEEVLSACEAPADHRFRVTARRSDKRFPFTSPQINAYVGGHLAHQLGMKVDLHHPEIEVFVEVARGKAYVYSCKHEGIGGLPVGTSGRGVVLFSGGIDSPVAAYAMMKRGMEAVLFHCYNSTINRDFTKIFNLARCLSRYQGALTLFMADLEAFQRHAIATVPADYRMVIYKRQMIREAARVAKETGALALVSGDSLGQVASQTLANIHAIYNATDLPILSPLIAMDKEEIVNLGRRIGTYAISTESYCDICSFMLAKHPQTHARREKVEAFEKALPIDVPAPIQIHRFSSGDAVAASAC